MTNKISSHSSLVRSSAAEYLTFVAAAGQGGVEAVYADENVWLTQKMMGVLYDVGVRCVFRSNPATIPAGKRPLFRRESGRHSAMNLIWLSVVNREMESLPLIVQRLYWCTSSQDTVRDGIQCMSKSKRGTVDFSAKHRVVQPINRNPFEHWLQGLS